MTYCYTTDLANSFIVGVGDNEQECRANAEQGLPLLPGAKLVGNTPVTLALVVCMSVTVLTKARSDDVLIRKILAYFEKDSKIQLHNDLHEDGSVTKHFEVDGKRRAHLKLKTAGHVAEYEKNGLPDSHLAVVLRMLEPFAKKKLGPEPEIEIASDGDTEALYPDRHVPIADSKNDAGTAR